MPRLRWIALVLAGAALVVAGLSGPAARGRDDAQRPARWWKPPADVRATLARVDARSLERFDRRLVSFGTRHTLSAQDDPNRGIGAARDWIKARFDEIAATSGGRMTVALDSFIQPATPPRVPDPTRITNVVATLRGTDTKAADRVYVVGGHYDSRVTMVNNATADAPGANNDGSGTSATLELARVIAPHPTDATIVFV